MIPVTKPFLPPQEEYQYYLDKIWKNGWLTNMGPLSKELEDRLGEYLGVKNLLFVTNGTIALQMAIKALDLKGEIITTPFSFVATTSAIVWEGCVPVFVDIDPNSLNIDATQIEAAITPNTSAILATHVYGNPCDVKAIDSIAKKHNLKVIYDAAHAFGVEVYGKSIFEYGDISTCSLHATKLYHSIEGGLVIANDTTLFQKLKYIRNFGISGFYEFAELGINGKNSEYHAAMGLVNLNYIEAITKKRKILMEHYDKLLHNTTLKRPKWNVDSDNNGAYCPVLFETEEELLSAEKILKENNVGTRRYFYPSLASALPYICSKEFPITDNISKKVLCLPLYYDLEINDIDSICSILESRVVN